MRQNTLSRRQQRRLDAYRNTRRIISSLDRYSKLRRKMINCEMPSKWRRKEYCRAVGCGVCRLRYEASETTRAMARFTGADNTGMAMLTIIFGVTLDPGQIGPMFEAGRKKLRNLIDYQRRRSEPWKKVEVLGYLETDALNGIQVEDILPERRQLLRAVGLPEHLNPHDPIWVVTLHALVRFDQLGLQAVEEALVQGWPQAQQANVSPFIRDKTATVNIEDIIEYALKHENTTKTSGQCELAWDQEWIATYYEAMQKWSQSFKRMKVSIGPRKPANQDPSDIFDDDDEVEPMPMFISTSIFSTIPTQYILGSHTRNYSPGRQGLPILSQGP